MKRQPPTVVERIDATLHTLNHSASGLQTGGIEDQVSRQLAKELLRARELGETLQGLLRAADAP